MKAEHLLEEEIDWELKLRKCFINESDKLTDKQRILRTILRAEGRGASETGGQLWEDLDLEEEQEKIGAKVQIFSKELESKGHKAKDFWTLESRLLHLN
jgi:hypothetical protein